MCGRRLLMIVFLVFLFTLPVFAVALNPLTSSCSVIQSPSVGKMSLWDVNGNRIADSLELNDAHPAKVVVTLRCPPTQDDLWGFWVLGGVVKAV